MMNILRIAKARIRGLFASKTVEDEIDEELLLHLKLLIDEHELSGMTRADAERTARLRFGNEASLKERSRDVRGAGLAGDLVRDLRYAARTLRKRPVFTFVAVCSLALGIGANTAIFSFLNTLLLTKLPVREPDTLYQLVVTHRTHTGNAFSYSNIDKLRTAFNFFDDVTGWFHRDFDIQIDQTPLRAHSAVVAGNFYHSLGVKPLIGRLIEPSDDNVANASVVVLGYGFWRRQFSGDANVLGKVIRIQHAPFTIIGVTPPEFGGAEIDNPRDITVPTFAIKRYDPGARILENPGFYAFSVLVRLKPGVTAETVRPVLRDVWPSLDDWESRVATDNWHPVIDIEPGRFGVSKIRYEFSHALEILMILVALVLLITCANLANLLVARAIGTRKETAVRLAIGAGRSRLLRQALTESFLLAAAGGIAGILIAGPMARAMLLFLPGTDAAFLTMQLDHRILFFAASVTVITALLFGLLPALQGVRAPLNGVMAEVGRSTGTGRQSRVSQAVVVAEVSVCLVLVIGSLLFSKSLENITTADLGFQRDNLLLVDINPPSAGIRGEQNDLLYRRLLDELNDTPGIVSASCSRITPISGSQWWDPAAVPGYTPARDETTTVYLNQVSPAYFRTLGIPILEGRDFTAADDKSSRRVAIVNQSFASHFFPGQRAIEKIFNTGTGAAFPKNERYAIFRNLEIVGVAGNTSYSDPHEEQKDMVYIASYQAGLFDITGAIEVRLAGGANANEAANQIRSIVKKLASGLDVEIRPFNALFERDLQRDRMVAKLSTFFGMVGLTLACIGLFGIVSNTVKSRTGEIGIRIAIGARRREVEWMIVREALLLIAVGVLPGAPLAVGTMHLARGLLYGIEPFDPVVLATGIAVLTLVGAVSAWIPAHRAASIDLIAALRRE